MLWASGNPLAVLLCSYLMSCVMSSSPKLSEWFYIQKQRPEAVLRLFCFPYAGGGTAIFRDWFQSLPEEIEVVAMRPPGRENRFSEAPISSLPTMVQLLYQNILPLLDKPFIFLGHSNGALTCFELARLLEAKQGPAPSKVILSAKCPPHIPSPAKSISHLSDAEFLAELKDIGGTPEEFFQNKEMMDLLLPILKADFSLSENFVHANNTLLKSETILFHGAKDRFSKEQNSSWQDLLHKPVELFEFSGGHFFIDTQRKEFLSLTNRLIKEHLITTHEGNYPAGC